MQKLWTKYPDWYGFALVLLIGGSFYLRMKGIWFGYPLPVHADEPFIVDRALKMVRTGDLNPDFFRYPSLVIYIQACIYQFVQFASEVFADRSSIEIPPIWFYLAGRAFTVVLSTLTVLLTYLIGRSLLSPIAGLFAAGFMAVAYLHVLNSYLVTVDNMAAFWVTLSFYAAVLIETKGGKTRHYLMAGLFAGLAIGSKYTAFVVIFPLLYVHFSRVGGISSWLDRRLLGYLIIIPCVFLLTTPFAIPEFEKFIYQLSDEARHYTEGHPGAESVTDTSYFKYLYYIATGGFGIIPSIFALAGFIWMLRDESRKAILLVLVPVLLFLFVGRFKVFFPRNLIAILPFLSMFAGAFIYYLLEVLRTGLDKILNGKGKLLATVVVVLLLSATLWQQLVISIRHLDLITLPDTRWISLQWVEENLPKNAFIGREHYTPPIEKYSEKFNVMYLGFFGAIKSEQNIDSLDYIIVSSLDYERYFVFVNQYPAERKAYLEFFERHELVKEFIPDERQVGGPRISIFRVRH